MKKLDKIEKYVTLTHTPTTINICIPAPVIKDLGLKDEKYVQVEYDFKTKVMKLTKIGVK